MKLQLLMFLQLLQAIFVQLIVHADDVECTYSGIVEKILYYKDDKFKMFYGGPIDRSTGALKWVSLISFEDESYKTRAVYEVCFINCDFSTAKDAEVVFVKVSDVDIKFKNTLTDCYKRFSDLLDGQYSTGKYIVVRHSDVAFVFYPEIFIANTCDKNLEENDRKTILHFLSSRFKTKDHAINYYSGVDRCEIDFENENEISFKPIPIGIEFQGSISTYTLIKKVLKNDPWKLYYIISTENSFKAIGEQKPTLVRIDSGCVSGQIYDDLACDCLDQLHEGLYQLTKECGGDSLIVHIPAHDGRGFGTAPKAETEIYKRGGRGRVHTTKPLDTISAAKLLYGSLNYDLRTYDGAAIILKSLGINQVSLLTDNVLKVKTLEKYGIEVVRKKTETQKSSCLEHIISKKDSENYYKN